MAEAFASESLKEAFATFVAWIEALLDTPNLLISPHMGWSSRQVRSRLVQTLTRHLQARDFGVFSCHKAWLELFFSLILMTAGH